MFAAKLVSPEKPTRELSKHRNMDDGKRTERAKPSAPLKVHSESKSTVAPESPSVQPLRGKARKMIPVENNEQPFSEEIPAPANHKALANQSGQSIRSTANVQKDLPKSTAPGSIVENEAANPLEQSVEIMPKPRSIQERRLRGSKTSASEIGKAQVTPSKEQNPNVSNHRTEASNSRNGNEQPCANKTGRKEVTTNRKKRKEPEYVSQEDQYETYVFENPDLLSRESGFTKGWTPEKIVAVVKPDGEKRQKTEVMYVVKWRDASIVEPVSGKILMREVPEMLLEFLEDNMNFEEDGESEEE